MSREQESEVEASERREIWAMVLELVRAGYAPQNAVELAAQMRRQLYQVATPLASEAAAPAGL